jgi:hypothetical protein
MAQCFYNRTISPQCEFKIMVSLGIAVISELMKWPICLKSGQQHRLLIPVSLCYTF